MYVRGLLADGHLADEQLVAHCRAQAHAGGDVLGEAGEVDHPALFVESLDGGQRLARIAQIAVGVVLGKHHAVLAGKVRHGLAALQRKGHAGGVLEAGDDVHQLRAVLFDLFLDILGDDAVFIRGHGDDAGVVGVHGLQSAQEGGVLGEDDVARLEQHLHQQVEALRAALHGQKLAGAGLDAHLREERARALDEGGKALGGAVLQKRRAVLCKRFHGQFGDDLRLQSRVGGVAAGKGDHAGLAQQFEDLADGGTGDGPHVRRERFLGEFHTQTSLTKKSPSQRKATDRGTTSVCRAERPAASRGAFTGAGRPGLLKVRPGRSEGYSRGRFHLLPPAEGSLDPAISRYLASSSRCQDRAYHSRADMSSAVPGFFSHTRRRSTGMRESIHVASALKSRIVKKRSAAHAKMGAWATGKPVMTLSRRPWVI